MPASLWHGTLLNSCNRVLCQFLVRQHQSWIMMLGELPHHVRIIKWMLYSHLFMLLLSTHFFAHKYEKCIIDLWCTDLTIKKKLNANIIVNSCKNSRSSADFKWGHNLPLIFFFSITFLILLILKKKKMHLRVKTQLLPILVRIKYSRAPIQHIRTISKRSHGT